MIQINGRITQLTFEAIESANAAPIIFGVISQKIMINKATAAVVIESTDALLPNVCKAIPAIKTGTNVLMTLLPINMTDRSCSVWPNSLCASFAPFCPWLA